MLVLIFIMLLFIYVGWFISSVLGVAVSATVVGLVYFIFTKFFRAIDVDPNQDSFADGVRSYIGMIFGALIFLTTPIWDNDGFCAHQTEAYEINKARTWEDVFKGRQPTEWVVEDVSVECREQGAWNYLGGWDYDDNWRVKGIYVISLFVGFIVLVILWFFGYILMMTVKESLFLGGAKGDILPPKQKAIIPGIGKTGREVVRPDDDIRFNLYLDNVDDIISKKHLSKGDYQTWFGRCAREYIDSFPKHQSRCSPNEMVEKIEWAVKHIPAIYAGKASDIGVKRQIEMADYISELQNL